MISLSWTSKLLQTYDLCYPKDKSTDLEHMMMPIGHLVQRAQIEVELDETGDIISAMLLEIEDAATLMPVTEDSGSRSSGISPHPLHDKLIYVAGDYGTYVDDKKTKYHDAYMDSLKQWVSSGHTCKTIELIYKYLGKGTLIHDLVECGVLTAIDGKLDKKKKYQKVVSQPDCLIRFYIQGKGFEKPWKDKKLYQNFIDYYRSKHESETDFCFITGDEVYCTDKHPCKIRFNSDKAKLISANETRGFTFRGRYASKENALSIGYETSQKIHNALRWIIRNQGYQRDDLTVLIWNVEKKSVFSNELFTDNPIDDYDVDTSCAYSLKVIDMIKGKKEQIEPRDGVVIMMLEAATEGRLSITCYQELQASEYYENLEKWYNECSWRQYQSKYETDTPSLNAMISTIYSILNSNEEAVESKKRTAKMKLLLPCILFGKKLPESIVRDTYMRVLQSTKINKKQWKKSLGILCALMRRRSADQVRENQKGAIWSMDVKENKENGMESTAYLYGRLIAVYYEIEWQALRASDKKREPNAIKYMVQAKKFPQKTINTLDSLSMPYLSKIGGRNTNLSKLKAELIDELGKRPDVKTIRNLDCDFMMGFECQMKEYETKKVNNESNKTEMEEK